MSALEQVANRASAADFARAEKSVRLAVACGAPPAMVLAVALASAAPRSVDDALAFLTAHGDRLRALARTPGDLRHLANVEPELRFSPELARVRADIGDHELRGKLVFRELVGQRSFFQVAALAIAGLEIDAHSAALLEHLGVNTQLADVGIWPLAVTRRVALRSDWAHGILAGLGSLLNPNMAAAPVGAFMRFLDRIERGQREGRSLDVQLADVVARRERIAGVGRPALGPDERNVKVAELARRYGFDQGKSWGLAWEIDAFFARTKRQNINSAGLQGAIMRDMGFSPVSAGAFCVLYFMVPVLAHATFAAERRKT